MPPTRGPELRRDRPDGAQPGAAESQQLRMGRGTPGGVGPGPGSSRSAEVLPSSSRWRSSRARTHPPPGHNAAGRKRPLRPRPPNRGGSRRCPCGAAREDAAVRRPRGARSGRMGQLRSLIPALRSSRLRGMGQQKGFFPPFRACCRVTLGKQQRIRHNVPQSSSGTRAHSTGSPTTISHTMNAQLLRRRTARDPHVCRGPFEGSSATTEPLIPGAGLPGMGVCSRKQKPWGVLNGMSGFSSELQSCSGCECHANTSLCRY